MNDPLFTLLWSVGSALAVTVALCQLALIKKRQPSAAAALVGMIGSSLVAIGGQDYVFTSEFWDGGRGRGTIIILFCAMMNFVINGVPCISVLVLYRAWYKWKHIVGGDKQLVATAATSLAIGVPLGILFLLMVYTLPPYGPWLHAKNLEFQVKRNIDPTDLQQWAMKLMSAHPGHYQDFYGTNMPAGLKKVQGFGHCVEIFTHGSGVESSVCVFGGSKGGPLLIVASPGYPTPKAVSIIPWKPGIYFAGAR